MQSSRTPSILVVGAGPAGVTLAYLLASRGIRVTLLERQRDFAREFRGEVLLPSGLEALAQAGLGEVFAGIPQSAPTGIELYAKGVRNRSLPRPPRIQDWTMSLVDGAGSRASVPPVRIRLAPPCSLPLRRLCASCPRRPQNSWRASAHRWGDVSGTL